MMLTMKTLHRYQTVRSHIWYFAPLAAGTCKGFKQTCLNLRVVSQTKGKWNRMDESIPKSFATFGFGERGIT